MKAQARPPRPMWLRGTIKPSLLRRPASQPKPASLHCSLPPRSSPSADPLLTACRLVLGRAYAWPWHAPVPWHAPSTSHPWRHLKLRASTSRGWLTFPRKNEFSLFLNRYNTSGYRRNARLESYFALINLVPREVKSKPIGWSINRSQYTCICLA